jgi:hypothetical protein
MSAMMKREDLAIARKAPDRYRDVPLGVECAWPTQAGVLRLRPEHHLRAAEQRNPRFGALHRD